MIKQQFAYLLLLVLFKYQIAFSQKIAVSTDTIVKKTLLLKGAELLRNGEFTLNEYYCYTENTDSVFAKDTVLQTIKNYTFYKMKWQYKSPQYCLYQEAERRIISTYIEINNVIVVVKNNCVGCPIFRLQGFEKSDIDELILNLRKNHFSRSEIKKAKYLITHFAE
jgi:hypothetical protein